MWTWRGQEEAADNPRRPFQITLRPSAQVGRGRQHPLQHLRRSHQRVQHRTRRTRVQRPGHRPAALRRRDSRQRRHHPAAHRQALAALVPESQISDRGRVPRRAMSDHRPALPPVRGIGPKISGSAYAFSGQLEAMGLQQSDCLVARLCRRGSRCWCAQQAKTSHLPRLQNHKGSHLQNRKGSHLQSREGSLPTAEYPTPVNNLGRAKRLPSNTRAPLPNR